MSNQALLASHHELCNVRRWFPDYILSTQSFAFEHEVVETARVVVLIAGLGSLPDGDLNRYREFLESRTGGRTCRSPAPARDRPGRKTTPAWRSVLSNCLSRGLHPMRLCQANDACPNSICILMGHARRRVDRKG
jgi:hypothetical protein